MKIFKAKKGSMGGFVSLLAVTGITLAIVTVVLGSLFGSINTAGMTTAANTSLQGVITTSWSALTLAAIVLTVIAAAAILRVVAGGFGGGE